MQTRPPINPSILLERLTITVKQFVTLTGYSKTTTHDLLNKGKLDGIRVNRRTMITTESVIRGFAPHLAAEAAVRGTPIDNQADGEQA
jgi:hypothetical protein